MTEANTKPWNVVLTHAKPDEVLYADFKEASRKTEMSIKFKTNITRIKYWVRAHEEIYLGENQWEFKQNLVTLKVKDQPGGNLIVKFHLSTGVVLIQGACFPKWRETLYATLKNRVDEMCACDTEHVMNATMLQSNGTEPGTIMRRILVRKVSMTARPL